MKCERCDHAAHAGNCAVEMDSAYGTKRCGCGPAAPTYATDKMGVWLAALRELASLSERVAPEVSGGDGEHFTLGWKLADDRAAASRAIEIVEHFRLGEFADALCALLRGTSEDTRRLDWLERHRVGLNEHYGTSYGWKFVASHNVTRLFVRDVNTIDLHDAAANAGNIREAIDRAARSATHQESPT